MSKENIDRLNGDLKRLEAIQRVLLSSQAGRVPDSYVHLLVEEIKFLWSKSKGKSSSSNSTKTKPFKISDPPNTDSKGYRPDPGSLPEIRLKPKHPEGWDN